MASTSIHIFIFPYPAQGHMLALLDLTHQLAVHGLKITILVTPSNLPSLNSLLSTHPNSIQPLVLPFPTHPGLPLGVEHVKHLGNAGNALIITALRKLEGQVIHWFRSHPSPPQAILSDFFLGFTNIWAKKVNVPRIAFFSTGAFLPIYLDHLLKNVESLWNLERVDFPQVPRSPSFEWDHLPSIFKRYKKGDSSWDCIKDDMLENFKSWALVFNSFHALDGEYLDHVKQEVGHSRVYAVGPLSSPRADPVSGSNSVLTWLDKCPDGSVVYVCFGSQKVLTKLQMEALAIGLERSETRFIWVVNSEGSQLVPDGFKERVADRGLVERVADRGLVVRGWAPQVEILNHKAVAGFVSHCGWNSILESIMAGVLVLGWPMEADQFLNARLLVEYVGSAVQVCEGEDTVPDPDVLGRVIGESIGNNIPEKERAKMLKDKAFEAVRVGGNSFKDLDQLLLELGKLETRKRS